ncbi:adenylate/guanylate cyclase domain-containing protein [Chloroflexota bacterium]
MNVQNPFTYGNPITDPSRFFGRRQEVEQIFSRLRNPEFESSSIVGERRMGKSSLLNFASHPDVIQNFGLDPRGYLFIYVDLQIVGPESTSTRLYQYLLRRIASRIEDPELKEELARLGHQDTIDTYDLEDAFEAIDRKGFHIILLMDEFENISYNTNFGPQFYYGLRSLAIHHNLAIITASRQDLVEISQSAEVRSSPFFNIFATINLPPLTRAEAEELLHHYLNGTGISFSQEEVEHIVKFAGLHPHFLQTAFWFLFEGHRRRLGGRELEEFVDAGFLRQAQPHFQACWEYSDDDEKTLLALLALLDNAENGTGRPRPTQELQQWYRRVSSVLNLVTKRCLLTRTDDAYALPSSAFSQWIVAEATSTTPTLVKPEEFSEEENLLLASLPQETVQEITDWIIRSRARYRGLFLKWLADPSTTAAVFRLLAEAPLQTYIEAVAPAATMERPDLEPYVVAEEDIVDLAAADRQLIMMLAAHDPAVTILFTKSEASTDSLKIRLGDWRAEQVMQTHNDIVRQHMAAQGGFEVKNMGNGFMLVFSSTRSALECAMDIQRTFAAYNEQQPVQPIHVCIGLHTGQPIEDADDFFGRDVIMASRISDQAQGREILVSSLVKELSESAGGIAFEEGRELELKGLAGTHRVYQVAWQ